MLGAPGRPGPNDRIHVGLIGTGYRSRDLTVESPAELKLVALADCDRSQMAAYLSVMRGPGNKVLAENVAQYQDYRSMFSKEKLDAVFVATTTHARALICIHAMQAGLDVYADCARHRWNGGVNWCIEASAPCIGCNQPHFAKLRSYGFYNKGEAT